MAYTFASASSQRLSVPCTALTTFTLSAWINLTANPSSKAFGQMMSVNANPTTVYSGGWVITSSGNLEAYVFDGAAKYATSTATLTTGVWTHVAAVIESGVSARAYINGSLDGSTAIGTPYSAWASGPIWKIAGVGNGSFTAYLSAVLAEMAAWEAVLSASEIASLARAISPRKIRPQSRRFHAPLIRTLQDENGAVITASGSPTVTDHPRIYY